MTKNSSFVSQIVQWVTKSFPEAWVFVIILTFALFFIPEIDSKKNIVKGTSVIEVSQGNINIVPAPVAVVDHYASPGNVPSDVNTGAVTSVHSNSGVYYTNNNLRGLNQLWDLS